MLNLVAIGEGVALVPEQMRRLPHDGVVFRELAEPVPRADVHVAWQQGKVSETLLEFVQSAKAAYAEIMIKSEQRLPRTPGT